MAVNLKIVSQVVASGTPGPAGKSAYQIAVDNGFEGTESEWLKELHPFKGWFDSVSELEEEHTAPSVGEYAYVKGATSSDPVKIYECSTEGSWSDSGRTVDTSTVQTFRSGEAVNDVDIDDEPTAGSDNLVKSGGVKQGVYDVEKLIKEVQYPYTIWYNNKYINTSNQLVNGNGYVVTNIIHLNQGDKITVQSSADGLVVIEKVENGSFVEYIKFAQPGQPGVYSYTATESMDVVCGGTATDLVVLLNKADSIDNTISKVNKNVGAKLAIADYNTINPVLISLSSNTVTILANSLYVQVDGVTKVIPATSLEIPNTSTIVLVYNSESDIVSLKPFGNVTQNDICVLVFTKYGQILTSSVRCLVDGLQVEPYFNETCKYIDGYGIDNNGIIAESPNEKCTGQVIVKDVDKVFILGGCKYAFYQQDMTVIDVQSRTDTYRLYSIPVPSEAYYFAASKQNSSPDSGRLIYFNTLNRVIALDRFVEDTLVDSIADATIQKDTVIADSNILDINNLDTSNPPVAPVCGSWDWQNAYLKNDGTLVYNESEIQTRLIPIIGGARYQYKGRFSGLSSIGFYDKDNRFLIGYNAYYFGTPVTSCLFTAPKEAAYVSFNCFKTQLSSFSVKCVETFLSVKKTVNVSGSPKETGIVSPIQLKAGNKHIAITQHLVDNICNSVGDQDILKLQCGKFQFSVAYRHNGALNNLLPQKENTANESDIKMVEFPMGVYEDYMVLKRDGTDITSLLFDNLKRLAFVRTVPAFTIRLLNTPIDNYTGLRLYINKDANNVINQLQIKDNEQVIYTKNISPTDDISSVYNSLVADLESINGYSFELTMGDMENLKITDLIATKAEGLPFVYQYSSNCKTTGDILYDNAPVFVEGLYNEPFEFEIVENQGKTRIFFEGDYLFEISFPTEQIDFGFSGLQVDNIEYDEQWNNADSKRPVIYGVTCHNLITEPSSTESADPNKVGNILYLAKRMKERGWSNISTHDVIKYIKDGHFQVPRKSWFIEIDDFGARWQVTAIISADEGSYARQRELLKMEDIKCCFSCHLENDATLFQKIKDGTATEVEKNTLTTYMSNEAVYRMRGLMKEGWSMSLHSLLYPVQTVTAATFDDVVSSIRNSIWWFERMYHTTPIGYCTHGTGNSSPYYRRVMQMYGIQAVGQDNAGWYSQGRRQAFYNRGFDYSRRSIADHAYQ